MSVPEGRCGFVLGDRPAPSHLPEREYPRSPTVCCWRTSWDGSDSGRCFWHAEVRRKEGHDPPRLPTGHPERLDGAYLRGATFRSVDLSGVNLTCADLTWTNLWKVKLPSATLRGAELFEAALWGVKLTEADLSEADLSRANLSGSDLSGANLRDALLFETDLSGANLSGANLSDAILPDATLPDVNLSRTTLSGAHLARVDLSGADLGSADLSNVNLSGGDLSGADLYGTTFQGADLSGADLSGVDLSGADVTDAVLAGVDLTRVSRPESLFLHRFDSEIEASTTDFSAGNLRAADLAGVVLSGLDLRHVDVSGWELPGVDLSGANLSGADLSDVKLCGADLTNANLSDADLTGANLSRANLTGTNLSEATLSRADLTAMTFDAEEPPTLEAPRSTDGAVFDSVDFCGADLRNHEFPRAKFRHADLSEADLYGAVFEDADLTGAILDEADCRQACFRDANLEAASFIECDLRSAELDGAVIYHATLTDCKMNLSTGISEVYAYPPLEAEERALRPVRSAATSAVDRTVEFLGLRGAPDDTGRPRTAGGRSPDREHAARSRRLERRAWTHQTIHRQLVGHGRIEQAIREKHYLDEQRARLRRARLERLRVARRLLADGLRTRLRSRRSPDGSRSDGSTPGYREVLWLGRTYGADLSALLRSSLSVLNLRTSYRLIRMSESPLYVARVVLVVAALFAFVVYPLVGEFVPVGTRRLVSRTGPGLPLDPIPYPLPWVVLDAWRLFVFSLLTFFEGTYLVLSGTVGAFLPIGDLVPSGVSTADLSGIRPTGTAVRAAWVERFLGALLVVPFALLFVQRLRLYVGASTSEEGLGGGLLSWLLGR